MPRKRHVSRNPGGLFLIKEKIVMPRKRHVSRNDFSRFGFLPVDVMPRKRHVSRNMTPTAISAALVSHASQEACE